MEMQARLLPAGDSNHALQDCQRSEFLHVVPNQRVQKPFGVRDLRSMVQQILTANERG